jgi:hypothetical protein
MLGRRHVQPSVVASLSALMVEGTFPTGTYLVTVHNPISSDDGDLEKALYGSFLPIPSNDMFPLPEASVYEDTKQPGAVVAVKGEAGTIKLNEGRKRISLKVKSMGDRPIQARTTSHTAGVVLIAQSGWLSLPLHRDEPATAIRSHPGTWLPTRHSCWHLCTLRAWRHQDCHAGPDWWEPDHQGWKQDSFWIY